LQAEKFYLIRLFPSVKLLSRFAFYYALVGAVYRGSNFEADTRSGWKATV